MGVAPSRGRGLKQIYGYRWRPPTYCRPFTGAWIETPAWKDCLLAHWGRPFTGAWIETNLDAIKSQFREVAPSRGRGLKLCGGLGGCPGKRSPLHGGVD